MINGAGANTFEYLVSTIGPVSAYEFLETALPEIIQRKKKLQTALALQDHGQAIKCANQSLGSVRFFGSGELEALLLTIHEMGSSDPDNIRNKLSLAFEVVITEISTWLTANQKYR